MEALESPRVPGLPPVARGPRGRAVEPAGGHTDAHAALERWPPRAAADDLERSGIRRARRPRVDVPTPGPGVARRGHRVVQGPDDRAHARSVARVRRGTPDLPAGGADPLGTPMARAGGIHQPRAGADLRHAAR